MDHSSTRSSRFNLSFPYSRTPWAQELWEYKDWNAPVSLILSLSPCRCPAASCLNQISSHSFRVVGCGLSVLRLLHRLFLWPLFTLSVNIHLYPTAADDIQHPSQAFVRLLNPVPIALAGQLWNENLNSLPQSPDRQWPGPSASDQFHFLWISVNQVAARSLPWSVDGD